MRRLRQTATICKFSNGAWKDKLFHRGNNLHRQESRRNQGGFTVIVTFFFSQQSTCMCSRCVVGDLCWHSNIKKGIAAGKNERICSIYIYIYKSHIM